ncbi:MAG: hypothetical protein J3Q66DRAFT_442891 [Benniella sp.]|nr:MAG: hypothetical protein J3Q66DRAFT_442891 [Benniella sp.]
MDTNSILVDIAVHDLGAQPVELRSGSWICSLAILPAESSLETTDLTISIAYQPPEDQPDPQHEIDPINRYTQLRIVRTGCTDPDSLVMMVPIRDPQRLFWGIQVGIDPQLVRSLDRYIFCVVLAGNDVGTLSERELSSWWQTPRASVSSCLSSSPVSMEPRHRLQTLLDQATHSDIRFSFRSPGSSTTTTASTSTRYGASSFSEYPSYGPLILDDKSILHAHSCILKTAGTPSIERLVSSNLIPDEHNTEGGGGSIREIRFEDSPSAAVDAVLRYVYYGQRPVLEPHCGYTLKDLTALATYLQLEELQEHCVELVLGYSMEQQQQQQQEMAYKRTTRARSQFSVHSRARPSAGDRHSHSHNQSHPTLCSQGGYYHHPYRLHVPVSSSQQPYDRARHGLLCRANYGTAMTSRPPRPGTLPERALQVLFAWGYKFPRMRRELIRAFVHHDGGWMGDVDETGMLQRFRQHEAFNAIQEEMVMEKIRRMSDG